MPNQKSNSPVFSGSKVTASDLVTINNQLKNLVKHSNWSNDMADFVCNNVRGRLIKTYGMALCLHHADMRIKSTGNTNQGLLPDLMQQLGITRCRGHSLKRVGDVLTTIMDDPVLWRNFVNVQLPRTSIYKLYTLKDAFDTYHRTGKKNADKKAFITQIDKIHNMTRNQIRQTSKKAPTKTTSVITRSGGII